VVSWKASSLFSTLKAQCGTLQAALQFWKKVSSTLEGWEFIINPYDQGVANNNINWSQCTVISPDVLTEMIE